MKKIAQTMFQRNPIGKKSTIPHKALSMALCLSYLLLQSSFLVSPKGGDELDMLKSSTLVVVLLEENPKIDLKLKHNIAKLNIYQKYIKTYNDNIKAIAAKYLSISAGITFKTMGEIINLTPGERENYSFLVYDRSPQADPGGGPLTAFAFDFYASQQEELQGMSDDYRDLINFDAADPKYHGEDDYRQLEVYAKSKKGASVLMFSEGLDMIVPTQGSLALCCTGIQKQFNDANTAPEAKGKKAEEREAAREAGRKNVAIARRKMLLVWKDELTRGVTELKIKPNYSYPIKIVSREEFDQAILTKDTSLCLLVMYPASKTQGAYRASVNYEHRIVDAETDDVLVAAVPVVRNGGMPPSYQKITDKQFKDLVTAEDDEAK